MEFEFELYYRSLSKTTKCDRHLFCRFLQKINFVAKTFSRLSVVFCQIRRNCRNRQKRQTFSVTYFPSGLNQVAIASLNQATIARGEIPSDKPYHSTSLAHFNNEYLCLMGQVAGTLPVCHRLGLLYQFYPDARDNTWTPQEGNYRSVLRALIQRRASLVVEDAIL